MAGKRWAFLTNRRAGFPKRRRHRWAVAIEALFGSILFVLGSMLLAVFITLAVIYSSPVELYISVWAFSLQITVSVGLILIGIYQMASLFWKNSASQERRNALVNRAGEIELLNELLTGRENLPGIPADKYPPVRGEQLRFRLFGSRRNTWGIFASTLLAVLFGPLSCILILTTIRDVQLGRLDALAIALTVIMSFVAGWTVFQFVRKWLLMTAIGLPSLEISDYPLQVAGAYQLHLSQPGKIRLRLIEVFLVCEEIATYNQGTDIRTESNIILQQRLLRKRGIDLKPYHPFEETFELELPVDAMHSFRSNNNRIQWKIVVQGNASGWPSQERSFDITVVPQAMEIEAA